jgi:hypothetical protein
MNRRQFVLAAILLAATGGVGAPAVASKPGSPEDFLRDLYARETERHNNRRAPDNDAFYAMFSREVRELMQAPRLPNPTEPVGPILHALFGRGVLPGTQVILGDVRTTRSADRIAVLEVTLTVRGQSRDLGVILVRQDGAWKIHEIEYDGPDTLTAHYRRITGRQ